MLHVFISVGLQNYENPLFLPLAEKFPANDAVVK